MNQGAAQRKSKRQKIKKQFGRKWYNQRSKILDIKTSQKTVLNTRCVFWHGKGEKPSLNLTSLQF